MRFTTRVGLALLLVAGMSIIVGAGSFTSTEADRPVNVSVVEDDEAYIGFQIGDYPSSDNGAEGTDYEVTLHPENGTYQSSGTDLGLIEAGLFSSGEEGYVYEDVVLVTNQFATDLDAELTVDVEDGESETYDETIDPGENVSVDVLCEGESDAEVLDSGVDRKQYEDEFDVEIDVDGETDGESGAYDRTVHVECEGEEYLLD